MISFSYLAYISSTSRGMVHMKSLPSVLLMNDPSKRELIDQLLQDAKLTYEQYADIVLNRSVIKPKQRLTYKGLQLLNEPQHQPLLTNLEKNNPSFFAKGETTKRSHIHL